MNNEMWDNVRNSVSQFVRGEIDVLDVQEHGHLGVALQTDSERYQAIVNEERVRATVDKAYVEKRYAPNNKPIKNTRSFAA